MAGAALLGAALPSFAQPDISDWQFDREKVSHEVEATGQVRVVNPWGSVTVHAGEGERVDVSIVGQRHREDPRATEVTIEETPTGLAVEPRFADNLEVAELLEWQARRIDIGVFVPRGVTVSVTTTDGAIEVEDLEGPATLESAAGDITYRGFGSLRAKSDTGQVFAQLRRSDWEEPCDIETRTGDIRAELLEGAAARVEVETRGWITTDYSLAIERRPGQRLKRGTATVGAGGQLLRLTSYSGGVKLLAVIVPESAVHPEEE
jgi:hypothetical protein